MDTGIASTYISSNSFSVLNDRTDIFQEDRRIRLLCGSTVYYGKIVSSTYTSLTTVVVELDSGSLDVTLTHCWLGIISPENTSVMFATSGTDGIMSKSDKETFDGIPSTYVHIAGVETITGNKKFTGVNEFNNDSYFFSAKYKSSAGIPSDPFKHSFASLDYVNNIDKSDIFSGELTYIDSDDQGDTARSVWGDGKFIYLANDGGGLHVYSVSDAGVLTHIDFDDQGDNAYGVWGDDKFIYLANYTGGLHVYSVSDTGVLTHIDSDDQGNEARYVWGDGRFIYLANGTGGLHTYSVSDAGVLTHIDSDDQGDNALGVWGDGRFIYLANNTGGLHVYSVSDAGILTHIDSDDQGDGAYKVWGDGRFIYLANNTGGLHVYSVSDAGILTHIDSDDQGDNAESVWGDGKFIYLANHVGGLHTYSVSDAGVLTHIDSDDQGDIARGVYSDGKFIYLANDGGGLLTYSINKAYEYDKANALHKFNKPITVNDNTVWHAGNDGASSGLSAQYVGGLEASQFLRSDASDELSVSQNARTDLRVLNPTSDTGAYAEFLIGESGTGGKYGHFSHFSDLYTSGDYGDEAGATLLKAGASGDLILGASSNNNIKLMTGTGDTISEAMVIAGDGTLYQGDSANEIWHAGNDSGLVHIADSETITGEKTFRNRVIIETVNGTAVKELFFDNKTTGSYDFGLRVENDNSGFTIESYKDNSKLVFDPDGVLSVKGNTVWHAGNFTPGDKEDAFSKNSAFNKNFGSASGTVCQGNDSRLSDARTPTSHNNTYHSESYITSAGVTYENLDANSDVGTGATQVAAGNHDHDGVYVEVFDADCDGDHTYSGITTTMTVDANSTGFGAALYITSGGNLEEADASSEDTMPCFGIACQTGTGSKIILLKGFIRDDSWNWTPGKSIYVSETTGALTQVKPITINSIVQKVGQATHADRIYFEGAVVSEVLLQSNRRLNCNGDLSIWQAGTSFTDPDITKYLADNFRIRIADTDSTALDVDQSTSFPTGASAYSFKLTCTTAQASFTGNQSRGIITGIEGYDYRHAYLDGYITLSFWVRATKTGTSCVCFQNADYSRSYIVEYTINTTNTWEYKTVTIAVDSSGSWDIASGIGLLVSWTLSCGSTKQTTAGSWQAGDYRGTSNQVNHLDTTNNTFYLKNIQVEKGQTATEFEYLIQHNEIDWALRYYEASAFSCYGFMTSNSTNYRNWIIEYNQRKRINNNTIVISGGNASPTISYNGNDRLAMSYDSGDYTTTRYFTSIKCFSNLLGCTT